MICSLPKVPGETASPDRLRMLDKLRLVLQIGLLISAYPLLGLYTYLVVRHLLK